MLDVVGFEHGRQESEGSVEHRALVAGQIAETGPIEDVLASPRHPYTQLLLSAVPAPPEPPPGLAELAAATGERGEPPKVIDPTPGCRFRPRCPVSVEACATVTPGLTVSGDREVACHVAKDDEKVRAFS